MSLVCGGEVDIRYRTFVQQHGLFLLVFLGILRVRFVAARRRRCPHLGITFSLFFLRSIGVFITDRGCVKPMEWEKSGVNIIVPDSHQSYVQNVYVFNFIVPW